MVLSNYLLQYVGKYFQRVWPAKIDDNVNFVPQRVCLTMVLDTKENSIHKNESKMFSVDKLGKSEEVNSLKDLELFPNADYMENPDSHKIVKKQMALNEWKNEGKFRKVGEGKRRFDYFQAISDYEVRKNHKVYTKISSGLMILLLREIFILSLTSTSTSLLELCNKLKSAFFHTLRCNMCQMYDYFN